jgi:cytochrome c oxidase subunit 1
VLLPQAIGGSGLGMTLWLISWLFHCFVLNGIVELYSYCNQFEDRGMSMTRLPLTIWAFFVTAIIGVFLSCIVVCCIIIDFDRSFGTSFFLSDIYIAGEVLHYQGGSPVLFEHLFWFGHPEVYIVLLPALGIASSDCNQCS